MELKTTIKDTGFILCQQTISDEGRNCNDIIEKTVLFDIPEHGTIVENQTVAGSFFINYIEVKAIQELNINISTSQDCFEMLFLMGGVSNIPLYHLSRKVPSGIRQVSFPESASPFKFLSVFIPEKTYLSLTQGLDIDSELLAVPTYEEFQDLLNQSLLMSSELQKIVTDIVLCERTAHHRRMYLEAKVTELLLLQLECLSLNPEPFNKLSQDDIERMHYAREIIINNLATPCSLIDLARKVGTNEFKLKKYFKAIFGTTVFGYWNDLKMNEAKLKLLNEKVNISEIAEYLGYKSSNHFSTAFRKHFGYTPSEIKRSNRFSRTIGKVKGLLTMTPLIVAEFPFELLLIGKV